jgi:hypothetical protein
MLNYKTHLLSVSALVLTLLSTNSWASNSNEITPDQLISSTKFKVPAAAFTTPVVEIPPEQAVLPVAIIDDAQLDHMLTDYLKDSEERQILIKFMRKQSIDVKKKDDIRQSLYKYFYAREFCRRQEEHLVRNVIYNKSIAQTFHRNRDDFIRYTWPDLTAWQVELFSAKLRDLPHEQQIMLYMIEHNESTRNEMLREFHSTECAETELSHIREKLYGVDPANMEAMAYFMRVSIHRYEGLAFSKNCCFQVLFEAARFAFVNNMDLMVGLRLALEDEYRHATCELIKSNPEIRKIYFDRLLGKFISHKNAINRIEDDFRELKKNKYEREEIIVERFAEFLRGKPSATKDRMDKESNLKFWDSFFTGNIVKSQIDALDFLENINVLAHILRSEDGTDWYSCLINEKRVSEDDLISGFSKTFGLWYAHVHNEPIGSVRMITKHTHPAFGAKALSHMLKKRLRPFSSACTAVEHELDEAEKSLLDNQNYIPALPAAIVRDLAVVKVFGVAPDGKPADYETRLQEERLNNCGIFN